MPTLSIERSGWSARSCPTRTRNQMVLDTVGGTLETTVESQHSAPGSEGDF
jgi:hypothetical protein